MSNFLLLAVLGGFGLALVALSAWRPPLGGAVLVFTVPLFAGINFGPSIALLRPDQAIVLLVALGTFLHEAPRERLTFTGLDIAVAAFALGTILIPWAVLTLQRETIDSDRLRTLLAPAQYFVVYLTFSRPEQPSAYVRLTLNLAMLASLIVGVVAVAELADVAAVRQLLGDFYTTPVIPSWDPVYRPASLLGHYSAVGAFALLNYTLALALAATRQPGFPRWWLSLVMAVNVVGVVASETWAPLLVLPLATVAVCVYARALPRHLLFVSAALVMATAALWPFVQGRAQQQLAYTTTLGFGVPETLVTRILYWRQFFVPAYLAHGFWLGTGTVIPSDVPERLSAFVDNEYLWTAFRAGVLGLLLLLSLLVAIAAAGASLRGSGQPLRRALGATAFTSVLALATLGLTSEYLTFAGVSQQFWMTVGLVAIAVSPRPMQARAAVLPPPRRLAERAQARTSAHLATARARLLATLGGGNTSLLGHSTVVFVGFTTARLLGFIFSVAAARLLATVDFGRMTYALAVASIAAVFVTSSPLGLSRFLSQHRQDAPQQQGYYSNWVAVVTLVLVTSAAATVVLAPRYGIEGWLLVGIVSNLAGVAVLETYREVQRGLGRYFLASVFYVIANLTQLVGILAAARLGHGSAAAFVTIYGLSSVATLLALSVVTPVGVNFSAALVRGAEMLKVLRFIRPLLLQSVFFTVWFAADLILVERLVGPTAAGNYGAAKTLANAVFLAPAAIGFVILPRVGHLTADALRRYPVRLLALATAVVAPPVAVLILFRHPVVDVVFGSRYPQAAAPLALLVVGMGLYGCYTVLASLWIGAGRPVIDSVATGVAMVCTVVAALALIPSFSLVGAAAAFTLGSAARLAVIGAYSAAAVGRKHEATTGWTASEWGDERRAAGAIAVLAEEVTGPSDEGYIKVTRELVAGIRARRSVLEHLPSQATARSRPARGLARMLSLYSAVRRPELREHRVTALVYVSRASCTIPALLRVLLIRLARPRTPIVMVALKPRQLSGWRGVLARRLWPDLLLIGTEAERDRCRKLGANAECITGGVDLDRFRPPRRGEKIALRQKWALPLKSRIVLHVGHAHRGRHLDALLPLADMAGLTVVVALSSRRGPDGDVIREELVRRGVRVLDGYLSSVEELYRLADCYVFTATSTDDAIAMPLSVMEAMASNLPVAAMRLGALPEHFADQPGVRFADTPEQLADAVVAQLRLRPPTRFLAEPYAWAAQARRLLGLLDELETSSDRKRRSSAAVLWAAGRRARWALSEKLRVCLFGPHPGVVPRPTPTERVVRAEPVSRRGLREPSVTRPRSDRVGLIDQGETDGDRSSVSSAVNLYGLRPTVSRWRDSARLLRRAVSGAWPLVVIAVDHEERWEKESASLLRTYVMRGGTVLVTAGSAACSPTLTSLCAAVGIEPILLGILPRPADAVAFSARAPWLTDWFTGVKVETTDPKLFVQAVGRADVLASTHSGGELYPTLVQRRLGAGRLLVSAAPDSLPSPLADCFGPQQAATVLPPMMLLRWLYGDFVWRAPVALANLTIDDPALRMGRLGANYDALLRRAQGFDFHVTLATIPRELPLADASVMRLLAAHPRRLSACYHGCDHKGYEFFLPGARRLGFGARSLDSQRDALERAFGHGRDHWQRSGLALDRVMVFPHGIGPLEILPELHRVGFIASCNFDDRDPLGASRPDDPWLGLRPADTAWAGFPLLWRRGLPDHRFVFDLFLGRPALTFAHLRALTDDLEPFVERAMRVNELGGGRVRWRGLEDIARHAYLQRRDPRRGWQVLMTANEICLHNPEARPRRFVIRRPHLPDGAVLSAGGARGDEAGELEVVVPARATRRVDVVLARPGLALPVHGSEQCTVLDAEESGEEDG